MVGSTADFHIDRKGVYLSLDDVPASVCKQCGVPYFEETQVDSAQAIIRTVCQQAEEKEIHIPLTLTYLTVFLDFFHRLQL
jgi:YgiT-type zinc finger domain-containing protein